MVEKKGTKAGKPSKSPELRERSPSLPVGWVPTWEVPVALKGVEWAKKGGEKLAEWINSEGPLALQILDSRAGDTKYTVELSATNLTVHSMYLDSFTLVFPAEPNLPISLKRLTSFGAGSLINEQSQPKSPLIRPGQSLEFTIEFPIPRPDDLKTAGWFKRFKSEKRPGEGRVGYWILNEGSDRTRDVAFGIRLN